MGAARPELRIQLLGGLGIEVDGEPRELPSLGRARSVLAYLALHPGTHPRGALAARFWPDVIDESARGSLRTALSAIRKSLGDERLLVATRDEVSLVDAHTDVQEFERLVAEGRPAEALALYRGPLMAVLEDDWVYEIRDEFRDRVGDLLSGLATDAEAAGDLSAAIAHTRTWAGLDPLDEAPVRELMRRMSEAGDRAGAVAAYERLSERLRKQLGIAPSAETREIARIVRSQAPDAPAVAAGVVALMFTDLVGSTELLVRLGEDEAERLRRDHFRVLRDVIEGHAGDEVKNLGDGLMAVFTSIVDAVRCAVALQQSIARWGSRSGEPLRVRVGINAGEPFREHDDWFGTPVVVAKRLCDAAEGSQILVSRLVCELVGGRGGFRFHEVGALSLKGLGAPVEAAEVEWSAEPPQTIGLPGPLVDLGATRLVGRARELARLQEAWEQARTGRPRVVLIAGDPGIGKTRLAAELCSEAYRDDGALVMFGRCDEETLTPYQPFVEALDRYAGEIGADELRLQAGEERALLARLIPAIERTLPPLAPTASDDPESDRFRLFGAVARLVREATRAWPAVLMLDDIHWADEPTLLLLPHLLRELRDVPLLVIGTYRATELQPPLAAALAVLRRTRTAEEIEVGGLNRDEVAVLVADRTDAGYEGDAEAVHERTEGNPFFVEELIRAEPGDVVPRGVDDLIRRRLEQLNQDAARTLAAAAVTGREFTSSLLANALGRDEDELIGDLEAAVAAHAVREVSGMPGRFAFEHALVRETVYAGLSAARRARLHQRVGEVLEPATEQTAPATLAYHFSSAGDLERALKYTIAAAHAARHVAASGAAAQHYDAAMALAQSLGRDARDDATVRELLIERAELRHERSDYAGSVRDAEAALAGARAAGDRRAEMRALNEVGYLRRERDAATALPLHQAALAIARELGDVAAEVAILNRLSLLHTFRLDVERGMEAGERALALATQAGDQSLRSRALDALKLTALWLGDLDRLERLASELLALIPDEQPWYRGFAVFESAFVPIARRDWPAAEERLDEADGLAHRAGSLGLASVVGEARSWLLREQGHLDAAVAAARSSLNAFSELDSMLFVGSMTATLATALLQRGDAVAAASALEHGLDVARQVGALGDMLRCAGQLALARSLAADAAGAAAAAGQAEQLLSRATPPDGTAVLFCAHGTLGAARARLTAGDNDAARALAAPVLAAAERAGWCEFVESAADVLAAAGDQSGQKTS